MRTLDAPIQQSVLRDPVRQPKRLRRNRQSDSYPGWHSPPGSSGRRPASSAGRFGHNRDTPVREMPASPKRPGRGNARRQGGPILHSRRFIVRRARHPFRRIAQDRPGHAWRQPELRFGNRQRYEARRLDECHGELSPRQELFNETARSVLPQNIADPSSNGADRLITTLPWSIPSLASRCAGLTITGQGTARPVPADRSPRGTTVSAILRPATIAWSAVCSMPVAASGCLTQ